jgi:hypothetical protein
MKEVKRGDGRTGRRGERKEGTNEIEGSKLGCGR